MKIFYILMISVLMSLFGVGCENGGDQVQAGDEPQVATVNVLYSGARKVVVESGELSATLSLGQCVGVLAKDLPSLKISAGDRVLCGEGASDNKKCEAKFVNVRFCNQKNIDEGVCEAAQLNKVILSDSNIKGSCNVVLAKKEEADAGAGADSAGGDGTDDPAGGDGTDDPAGGDGTDDPAGGDGTDDSAGSAGAGNPPVTT